MTDIEKYENAVGRLREILNRAQDRHSDAAERESIGYAVFAEQDQKSRKKLDALNSESITLAGDTEALQAALTEANKRLLAAQNAKSVEEDRADAMEARRIFHEELAENGKRLDEAMQILVAESA